MPPWMGKPPCSSISEHHIPLPLLDLAVWELDLAGVWAQFATSEFKLDCKEHDMGPCRFDWQNVWKPVSMP